ncbi:MAG: LuxR C-terminal-related transcriptional regulator [Pseudonocardia sp.]
MTPEAPVRVLFLEDNREFADVMSERWNARGIEVAGVAPTVTELHQLICTTLFDVAVLDVTIRGEPGLPGLQVARWLLQYRPDAGVLIYTNYDDEDCAAQFLGAIPAERLRPGQKGVGYLVKDVALDLPARIMEVNAGETVLDEQLAVALARHVGKESPPGLTDKEKVVLRLLGDGLKNSEIARECFLAPGTVTDHLTDIFRKLDIPPGKNKRVSAALYVARHPGRFHLTPGEPMIWPPPTDSPAGCGGGER